MSSGFDESFGIGRGSESSVTRTAFVRSFVSSSPVGFGEIMVFGTLHGKAPGQAVARRRRVGQMGWLGPAAPSGPSYVRTSPFVSVFGRGVAFLFIGEEAELEGVFCMEAGFCSVSRLFICMA